MHVDDPLKSGVTFANITEKCDRCRNWMRPKRRSNLVIIRAGAKLGVDVRNVQKFGVHDFLELWSVEWSHGINVPFDQSLIPPSACYSHVEKQTCAL